MASLFDAVERPRVIINTNDFDKPKSLADNIEREPEVADGIPDHHKNILQSTVDKLFGLHGEERYQLWPERLVRDAVSAPHDVMTEGLLPPGLRREDFTDIPAPSEPTTTVGKALGVAPVGWQPNDNAIEKAQAVSALAGTGGLAGAPLDNISRVGTNLRILGKKIGNQITEGARNEAGMALGVVPVDLAKKLNFKSSPVSDVLKQAVSNTPSASIDADGHLVLKVLRNQLPDQEMAESVRGGVFYLPEGSKYARYYNGTTNNNYGGMQSIEGETAFKNPLVVRGQTGGKAPENAYTQITGDKKAFKVLNSDVMEIVNASWMKNKDPQAYYDLVNRFLDKHAPEMRGYADHILDNSNKGNQLRYALQEAAIASAARKAGHDGIIGYSEGRGPNKGKPFLSEIFDVRENRYPSPDGDFSVHPSLYADSSKESAALQANKLTYPLAKPNDRWTNTLGQNDHLMQNMTPDEFLKSSRPLKIDAESRENIDALKQHIQEGKPLDPLELQSNGKEDGRHRAIAAKELGIKQVPVLNFRETKPFYSAVENAVAAAKQPKADAQQWLSFLKNQPGVKQEELAHLGLDKLSGSITKDDLLKAVQEGQPQIKEVFKGDIIKELPEGYKLHKVESTKNFSGQTIPETYYVEKPDGTTNKAAWNSPEAATENILKSLNDKTKYHSYQLPGGPLSRDTEILTNRGWKKIDAVEIGDIVMTRQDETDLLEWQPVEATTKVYAEELYHFFSQSINMRVTENHQMIAKKRRRNQNGLVRLTAKELWNKSEMIIPLTGIWNGGNNDKIFGFDPHDLAELFGWYLAEGSYKHKNGNKHTIQIAQCIDHNPEKCARIEALLDRMGLPWRYYGGAYGIGTKTINKDLVELFHEQPISEFKFVPYFFFQQSKSVIQSLLDGLILGDGCTAIQPDRLDKTTFFTKSQQLADDVQILILMTGKCATIRQRPSGLYCVGIKHKEWSSVDDAKFEIAPYNDFAFCVTVKNHAIYVRRFGVAAFTGNSNYREMLLTLPVQGGTNKRVRIYNSDGTSSVKVATPEELERLRSTGRIKFDELEDVNPQTSYTSSHWDEPNVLAHIRMNDRNIDGKKSLHLEEIQSDWHQAGRKSGYSQKLTDAEKKEAASLDSKLGNGEIKEGSKEHERLMQLIAKDSESGSGVPDAPFKKTWDELALKKAITHAVKNGYDSISWTPGEAQAARYDLSKSIGEVHYNKSRQALTAYDHNGNAVIAKEATPDELTNIIGKDVAEKLFKDGREDNSKIRGAEDQETYRLKGQDLKVGGQGMKAFYDKMLVDKMNALTKKYGGKVEKGDLGSKTYGVYDGSGKLLNKYKTKSEAEAFVNEQPRTRELKELSNKTGEPVHVLKITPELREHVLKKGFPLFSAGVPVFSPIDYDPFKKDR